MGIFFNCNTVLVETFKEVFGNSLNNEGNRVVMVPVEGPPPQEIESCVLMPLNYHKLKKLPLLGALLCPQSLKMAFTVVFSHMIKINNVCVNSIDIKKAIESRATVMIEFKDVVIAGITSFAAMYFNYLSIKNSLKTESMTLTEKQKKRQHKLAQKELWEHAAQNTALGFSMFTIMVYTASTDMSGHHILLRLILALLLYLVVYIMLNALMRTLFRSYRQ